MAVLVTRPHPDNEATARALRDRGFMAVLAPMLRFEPVVPADDLDEGFGAVIVTSANAFRAIEAQLAGLLQLPLFAVGEHTAAEARRLGFAKVIAAEGDASKLRERVRKEAGKGGRLLYLAGADLSRDLAGELTEHAPRCRFSCQSRPRPISGGARAVRISRGRVFHGSPQ